jgi:hypothetical protein
MSTRRLAVVLVLLAASWSARPTAAAPDWTSPIVLPFTSGAAPVIAFADGGVEFSLRVEVAMPLDIHNVSTQLIVSRKPPGGPSVDELVLSSTPTAVPAGGTLAVAPNGAAVVSFPEGTSNDFMPVPPLRWRALYRSAAGAWESPVTLFADLTAPPAISNFQSPFCAIAVDGTAVAGAAHPEPDDGPEPAPGQSDAKIDAAIHPANGVWQPAQTLSPHNNSVEADPGLGADDAGNFTIAWRSRFSEGGTSSTNDDRNTILVRRRLAGQSIWNAVEDVTGSDITKDAFGSSRGVAIGPDGHAVIAYQYPDAGGDYNVFAAVRSDSAHTFSTPEQLVDAPASSSPQAVGVGPDGTAYVFYWYQGNSSAEDHFGMVKRAPGGTWTMPTPVSPLDFDGFGGGIAFRGSDAIAVWFGHDTGNTVRVIEATRWPGGAGSPEAFRDLDPLPSSASVSTVISDRAGSVVAVWSTSSEVRSAAFDGGGPFLVSSSIPSPIIAGVAASFSATFADLWSAVAGSPSWDFGDGMGAASGDTVGHAFAAAGTYTVTATAMDTHGNAGAAAFAVTVGECESLSGIDALLCRCSQGAAILACAGQTLPGAVTKRFTAACGAVDAARTAGAGKKARKAAGRAVQGFKKAKGGLRAKAGRKLPAGCRDGLTGMLDTARTNATTFKGSF